MTLPQNLFDHSVQVKALEVGFDKLNDRLVSHIQESIITLESRLRYPIHFAGTLENISHEFRENIANPTPAVIEFDDACHAYGNCLEKYISTVYREVKEGLEQAFESTFVAFGKALLRRTRKYMKRMLITVLTTVNEMRTDNSFIKDVAVYALRQPHIIRCREVIKFRFEKLQLLCKKAMYNATCSRLLAPMQDDIHLYHHHLLKEITQFTIDWESDVSKFIDAKSKDHVARVNRVISDFTITAETHTPEQVNDGAGDSKTST